MTLAEFMVGAGVESGGRLHDQVVDGVRQVSWPDAILGQAGWWWCIARPDGTYFAGGWTAGDTNDRNAELACAMTRLSRSRSTEAA